MTWSHQAEVTRLRQDEAYMAFLGGVRQEDAVRAYLERNRHVFRMGPFELRTHHLHLTHVGGAYWSRILAFRDYLRAHPDMAAEYEALEVRLAAEYPTNRRGYTRAKRSFVSRECCHG